MWQTIVAALTKYESIAIWLEGIALVAIFFLDWREYRKQGLDRLEQHKESAAEMEIMRSHAKAAEDGAAAARANAEVARINAEAAKENIEILISKERARLRVEVVPFTVELPVIRGQAPTAEVRYRVHFYGYTPAFIVEATASGFIQNSEEPSDDPFVASMGIPNVLSPTKEPMTLSALIFPSLFPKQSEIDAVLNRKLFLHFHGCIKYKDVFDRDRETRFRFRWNESIIAGLSGQWTKCGAESDNKET